MPCDIVGFIGLEASCAKSFWGPKVKDGWYLISTPELEQALPARRNGDDVEVGVRLTNEEAVRYRNAGNLPDEAGRWLRLVLQVGPNESVEDKRRRFEPDFHEKPSWRRDGSKPVNVVPLRSGHAAPANPWWEQDDVRDLETEWRETGKVEGLVVPEEYRSFALKTIASLKQVGVAITPDSVADSIARWLAPDEVEEIRAALKREEPGT